MITAQSLERGSLVEWAGGRRATLAIVFTDVVGSAALGNLLADDRMKKEIRDPHFTRGAELIAVNDGRLIKTNGDSIIEVDPVGGTSGPVC